MLLRGAPARDSARRVAQLTRERGFGLDGAVVPGLVLLVARDLARYDPTRILAWRLSHDERLQAAAAWLGPILPAPSGALDRDPVALALASLGVRASAPHCDRSRRSSRRRRNSGRRPWPDQHEVTVRDGL